MDGTYVARTPGDVALALGVEIADLQPLIDSDVLRVLPVTGGSWVTSDAAIVRAATLRAGGSARARHLRGGPQKRASETPSLALRPAQPQRRTPAAAASPSPPPLTPPARSAAASTTSRRRQVPVDHRRDVQPDARIDMRTAAQRLQCDERAATRLARDGALRATRLGREWVTTESALDDYIRGARPRRRNASRNRDTAA